MTDEVDDPAYRVFARMHPHEAYDEDPELFWEWFHGEHPHVAKSDMVESLEASREQVTT